MLNYIKSELYRVTHSKNIYVFTIVCMLLLLAAELVLCKYGTIDPNFQRNTTSYVFGMMRGYCSIILMLSLMIADFVFTDEYKNKTLANSISYGYSRGQLFLGKMISGFIVSICVYALIIAYYIIISYSLLQNGGTEALVVFIRTMIYFIPIFIGAEAAAYAFIFIFDKTPGCWMWILLVMILPEIISLLGGKIELFRQIGKWQFTSVCGVVSMGDKNSLAQALIVGVTALVVFTLVGYTAVSKKEFK